MVIELESMISANAELEPPDAELEPDDEMLLLAPKLPAVLELLEPPAVAPELLLEAPVVPPDTVSPGVMLARETIVPLVGAYSLVLLSACSAFWRFAWALMTAACAEAIADGEGVDALVVEVVVGRLVLVVAPGVPELDDAAARLVEDPPPPELLAGLLDFGLVRFFVGPGRFVAAVLA